MLDNILSIIDSKIQTIIFELNSDISQINGHTAIPNWRNMEQEMNYSHALSKLSNPNHQKTMLIKIEESSTIINRLLTLRSRLEAKNIEIVYNLVSNNYYLDFSSEELAIIVDGKPEGSR